MRIYTRTGDQGETGLYGGQRVLKCHPRIDACGSLDEANALLGVCAGLTSSASLRALLERLQTELFTVGADVATPVEADRVGGKRVPRVSEGMCAALEGLIDEWELATPPLQTFILPGGSPAAAHLHLARTVVRRAERALVDLTGKEALNPEVVVYVNRLSDLLFVLARAANHLDGVEETPWLPG